MSFNGRNLLLFFIAFVVLFTGFSSVSASSPPAKIVSGFISTSLSSLMKWVWSFKSTAKKATSGRSMVKFEGGYTVETVFDGSKLGVDPYSLELLPNGELLILDSANSNLYRISSSLSLYSRPKLVAGSPEGYSGHVDGRPREARMNHPKGVAVDDRGNIYVADTENMAIRKISDTGVTTIAGGKRSRGSGHVDGPSEEAKFSDDFDVVYVGSSCSLLVIDRGNRAIREIQLHFDDCAYQYGSSFPLGIAVLLAAGFFGYMLGLLQRRVGSIVSSQTDVKATKSVSFSPYQKSPSLGRPPLIPIGDEVENQEGAFGSLGKLLLNAGSTAMDIIGGIFPGLRRKESVGYQYQQPNMWASQESFEIPKEEEPPGIETRAATPKKTYAFMSKDAEKTQQQLRESRDFYCGWAGEYQQKKQEHNSSIPRTYYEQSCEKRKEIVFGAVQEGRPEAVIKPTDYAMDQSMRFRNGYTRNFQSYT